MTEYNGGSSKAEHLCVLVHGLWGEPKHLASVAAALRDWYTEDELHILVAKSNSGYFTYDGIETGGERVCSEIEQALADIKDQGGKISTLSVVGYSLGGLVARYAVGLLEAQGLLDTLACRNFVAFASPFLGVRSPTRGVFGSVFNAVGARSLSMSGRQLFGIDDFRDTGRPLLAIMADPQSIFMAGLRRFQRRSLYANIVNDRSANYYTTAISRTDPFASIAANGATPDALPLNFVPGYDDVLLDHRAPIDLERLPGALAAVRHRVATASATASASASPTSNASAAKALRAVLANPASRDARMALIEAAPSFAFVLLLPVGLLLFLLNNAYQGILSTRRRQRHAGGLAGFDVSAYQVPLWVRGLRNTVEEAYEEVGIAHSADYLTPTGSDTDNDDNDAPSRHARSPSNPSDEHHAVLALSPDQFAMIESLDALHWRKHRVWIHKVKHSHAAMIVRHESPRFAEGKNVLRHFSETEFLL